ncbi:hypothetical protein ACG02S_07935 [Roseateles sp. DC23W]|uniref:Phasin protein n=1 Tax=Pelomonas dachongensis TaxID=3299029 RepID=A0ABW7ELS3_9BURK
MPRSKHRPGRKSHRPRTERMGMGMGMESVTATPLQIATNRAVKLNDDEQRGVLFNPRAAFNEFRAGRGSLGLWMHLADAINVGQVMAANLGLASNHTGTFAGAIDAMRAVHDRFHTCGSWTLRAVELEAFNLALCVHAIQLQLCSRGELGAAYTTVANRARGALAGNAAPGTYVCGAPSNRSESNA